MIPRHDFDPVTVSGVRSVLAEARRRWFLIVWLRLGAYTACLVAVSVLGAWAVWRLVHPSALLASLLAVAVVGVTLAFLAWRAGPLRRRPSDRVVARYVEERVPELDEVFISAVQCLDESRAPAFAGLVVDDAARRVAALDLDRVVSRADLRRRGLELAGAVVGLLAVMVALRDPLLQAVDVIRMAVAPPVVTIEVAPGDVQVREGSEINIRARAVGVSSRVPREPLVVKSESARGVQQVSMADTGDWQTFSLPRASESFRYRISGYNVASATYRVDVKPIPRVARIDVHYEYPPFAHLEPRVDEDAGDVYAPAGTKVRLVVHTTVPVDRGEMTLASGTSVTLATGSVPGTLDGRMTITKDDAYRLNLLENDGYRSADDTEYFIRTVDDRPPQVQVLRPASDRRVTRLEEVVIEARADDDFGIDRLELAYAARGGKEHVVPIGLGHGTSVSGRHTLFIEDLDVQPGDFVSYYVRARDIARGKRPTETRSDIFFLEVRPFNEEFEAAQSAAMAAAGGGSLDDLSARQKELIVATWKLERRSGAGRSADDIRALARAQAELKTRAESAAARLGPRGSQQQRRRPGQPVLPTPLVTPSPADPMRLAIEAMGRSHKSLEALQTGPAIPHEMEALNQLLRAEADIQRRQVTRQQSASGRGGQTGNQDLSSLFDRELQRQQQTNYENRSSAQQAQTEEERKSSALDRLRELARRQDELGRREQELARRQAQLSPDEVRRQLERLTREQEELRRQAEQVAAQLQQQQQQQQQGARSQQGRQGQSSSGGAEGAQADARSLQQAAEAMQQSARGLSPGELQEAAAHAQRAAERLRQAERGMSAGQPAEMSRAAGDAQLEAAQLADTERRVAGDLRSTRQATPDELRQLAGQQERAADRAARLADRARELGKEPAGQTVSNRPPSPKDRRGESEQTSGAPDPARQQIAETLSRGDIEQQLRTSAKTLRQLAERGTSASERDEQREAERAEGLARTLEKVARGLGADGQRDTRAELSEQLARAGELRDRLAELSRQLRNSAAEGQQRGQASVTGREGARVGDEQGRDQQGRAANQQDARGSQADRSGQQAQGGPQGQQQGQEGRGAAGQQAGAGQQPGQAAGRGGSGGGSGGENTAPGPEEVTRELRSLRRLADSMGQDGKGLQNALESLEGYAPSRSAPGTEVWKQDFSKWEALRKDITDALEKYESRVSGELQAKEREHRLDAGASDAAPDSYRRELARYYRSLARKPTQ